jgi:hypothetical protein
MKNCSCIFARQRNDEEAVFFEGNHPLPFFWLMLFDKEDVESYRAKMSKKEDRQEDTNMVLDKLKAISRAADRRDYVKKHVITCLPLFDDWLYYLQVSDFSDMKIYVDLYHIGSHYNNINDFCDSMLKAIVCFDDDIEAWNEDTIAATCGYESRHNNKKRFSDMSKAYRELNQKDIYGRFDKKLHLKKQMSFRQKLWLVGSILLIIIALSAGIIWYAIYGL